MEQILARQTVRKYKPTPVSRAKLNAIIRAAQAAPSACNMQPARFFVCSKDSPAYQAASHGALARIRDTADWDLEKVAFSVGLSSVPDDPILYGAPACIFVVVCGGMPEFSIIDGAMAVQNILIAAESLGLATCPVGLAAMAEAEILAELEKLREPIDAAERRPDKARGMPQKLVMTVAIGEPDMQPVRQARKTDRAVFSGTDFSE
jgi:nitroreductase